jgi:hypothetical protein
MIEPVLLIVLPEEGDRVVEFLPLVSGSRVMDRFEALRISRKMKAAICVPLSCWVINSRGESGDDRQRTYACRAVRRERSLDSVNSGILLRLAIKGYLVRVPTRR